MKKLLLSLFCISTFTLYAQDVLLKGDGSPADTHSFGPNQKHFFYEGYGYIVNIGQPVSGLKLGVLSGDLNVFFRYKRKISSLFSLGGELGYEHSLDFVKPKGYNILDSFVRTSSTIKSKKMLEVYSLYAGPYFRINFDPHRGDNMGIFLDLGINGLLTLGSSYKTNEVNEEKIKIKTKFSNLPFINNTNAEVVVRLGMRKVALSAKYRLMNFDKDLPVKNLPEFPKLTVGVDLGLK